MNGSIHRAGEPAQPSTPTRAGPLPVPVDCAIAIATTTATIAITVASAGPCDAAAAPRIAPASRRRRSG